MNSVVQGLGFELAMGAREYDVKFSNPNTTVIEYNYYSPLTLSLFINPSLRCYLSRHVNHKDIQRYKDTLVQVALNEAKKTIHGITGIEVEDMTAKVDPTSGNIIEYHTAVKIAFGVEHK
jgi:flavin-binding protein dodecin